MFTEPRHRCLLSHNARASCPDLPAMLRHPPHGDVACRGARYVESSHQRISLERSKQHFFDARVGFLVISFRLFSSLPEAQSQDTIWLNIGFQHDLIEEPRLHTQNGPQPILDNFAEYSCFARPTDKIDNSSKHRRILSRNGGDVSRLLFPSLAMAFTLPWGESWLRESSRCRHQP